MATPIFQYDDLVLTESVEEAAGGLPMRIDAMQVPKRHGALVTEVPTLDVRRISWRGKVQEASAEILRSTLDTMDKVLHRFGKKLRFWDDRYLTAYCSAFGWSYIPGSAMCSAMWTAEFMCPDPFWYSDIVVVQTETLDGGDVIDATHGGRLQSLSIDNFGTAPVFPIITISNPSGDTLTRVAILNRTTGRSIIYSANIFNGFQLEIDCGMFTVLNGGIGPFTKTEDLTNFSGTFLWLDPGVNELEIQGFGSGTVNAQFSFQFRPRYY